MRRLESLEMINGLYCWTDTILRTSFQLGGEYDGYGKDRRKPSADVDGLEITTHMHEIVTRL